jgi:hypothetical protein
MEKFGPIGRGTSRGKRKKHMHYSTFYYAKIFLYTNATLINYTELGTMLHASRSHSNNMATRLFCGTKVQRSGDRFYCQCDRFAFSSIVS